MSEISRRQGDRTGGGWAGEGGPRDALERLRRRAEEREAALRDSLHEAALEAAGEVGWRRVSVELIIRRAGISRARFYRLFGDKDECLAAGHRAVAVRLIDEILGEFAGAPDPRLGLRRALRRVAALTEERPLLARGLLSEARLGGGAVSTSRTEVFERLSRAAADACREIPWSRHSPPPTRCPSENARVPDVRGSFRIDTRATFILTALATAVSEATTRAARAPLSDQVDTLVELACLAWGQEAAGEPG